MRLKIEIKSTASGIQILDFYFKSDLRDDIVRRTLNGMRVVVNDGSVDVMKIPAVLDSTEYMTNDQLSSNPSVFSGLSLE
jgi:hypothetical protein